MELFGFIVLFVIMTLFTGTVIFALRKIGEVSKQAMETLLAKNLKEVAEVEAMRDQNAVNLQSLMDAQQKAWEDQKVMEKKLSSGSVPEHPLPLPEYVTLADGRKVSLDELEVL